MEFLKNGAIAIEGDAGQIADQLIKNFIGPAYDSMEKIDKKVADYFAFQIAGKAIACHLHTVETISIDEAATALKQTVDALVKEIKKDRLLRNPASKKKS